jgi:hypothetical protein
MPLDVSNDWMHIGVTMPYDLYSAVKDEAIASKTSWGEVSRAALREHVERRKAERQASITIPQRAETA